MFLFDCQSQIFLISCSLPSLNIAICFFIQDLIKTLEERLALISDERASFEELLTTAATEFPADVNVIELHQKYAQIFKHPVTLPGDDIDVDDDTGNERRLSGTDP